MQVSVVDRQNRIREALARWRWDNPRPVVGDYFEQAGQRWTVVGFEHRHVADRATELRALVLESRCCVCGERYTISLPRWKLSPSPSCPTHAAEHVASRPSIMPDGLPFRLHALLRDLSLVRAEITQPDFAALALPLVPGRRKPEKLAQALRRMAKRNQLPEGVTLTPSGFRFD